MAEGHNNPACLNSKGPSRRKLLIGLSASASAAAVLGYSQETTRSPLRDLYHQWQSIKDECADIPQTADESRIDRLIGRLFDIEQRAADFIPTSADDLAMKIIFADDNGDMDGNIHQQSLAKCAYAMAGLEPRVRKAVRS